MLVDHGMILPCAGPVWGPYPLRPAADRAAPWRRPRWCPPGKRCRRIAEAARPHAKAWLARSPAERRQALGELRGRLRSEGLRGDAVAQALGVVSAVAERTLGWWPRSNQRMAAAALLDGRMAEMATGEGKTLAVGLAAAVAALAGVPVHVVTANGYLAQRDARTMAPLFAALGLRVAALGDQVDDVDKPVIYGHDLVYTTAKNLAFDFLRDQQDGATRGAAVSMAARLAGPAPAGRRLRGLGMPLLDESDSLLTDQAETPLILARSAPQAARRAFLWQALALARQLQSGVHFRVDDAERAAWLGAEGEARLAELVAGLGGPWQRPRYRREAVQIALAGLHAFRRDRDYLVRDGQIEVLDQVTGRVAAGRVWSRGLHTLLALKEGLSPSPETETSAQITFQRFFQRYWRLSGISGTLCEAAAELRAVYGAGVVRIPTHRPCRRRTLPTRCFDDADALAAALVDRVRTLQAQGRPVLIGTDSVAESLRMSEALAGQGIAHRVLNAHHDAEEAAIVAEAGRAGRVTVATRMAGRGTDIELDPAARAAGGLHVLSCQRNPSRRLDRQLAGRAGRQGDPGSAEAWLVSRYPGLQSRSELPMMSAWNIFLIAGAWASPWLLDLARRDWQRQQERRRRSVRQELLQQDLDWERRLSFAGSPG